MAGAEDRPAVPPEVLEGMALGAAAARELEARAEAGEVDAADRTRLIGYYAMAALASPEAAFLAARQLLTLALDHPEAPVLGTPFGVPADEAACAELGRLWRRHIETQPRNARMLENAARFFSQVDRSYAEHLRYRLQLIDPVRYADFEIDFLPARSDGPQPPSSLPELEAALQEAEDPGERFHLRVRSIFAAWRAGEAERAVAIAQEVLQSAKHYQGDWDYGNAIHDAHQVLGLAALAGGDRAAAVAHLRAAGRAPGSPQLHSFGPDMTLARRLLEVGERGAVLRYLEQCRSLWELGAALLETWIGDVSAGRAPNFLVYARL